MRTEQLIQAMAADSTRPAPAGRMLPAAVLATALAAAAVFLPLAGARPDLGAALMELRVLVKQAFPVLLAIAAGGAALRLACPGMPLGRWKLALAAAPLLLILAVAGALLAEPRAAWVPAMLGESRWQCVVCIGVLSVPLLGATLWALRCGASTRPAASGALAGLLSGGAAAAVYAVHCVEDSPLFFALWYGLAIVVVAAAGAALGPRVLRW